MASLKRKVLLTGDSPSLWNCTLSPGWSHDELALLRLALMRYGVGNWKAITDANCLPGKTRTQLYLQSQRLLGQQSMGELMGVHLDPIHLLEDNRKREGVTRKNGYIVNSGNNPTKEERIRKIRENTEKYGLTKEMIDSIVLPDRRFVDASTDKLNKLKELRNTLREMQLKLQEKERAAGLPETPLDEIPDDTASDAAGGEGNLLSVKKFGGVSVEMKKSEGPVVEDDAPKKPRRLWGTTKSAPAASAPAPKKAKKKRRRLDEWSSDEDDFEDFILDVEDDSDDDNFAPEILPTRRTRRY